MKTKKIPVLLDAIGSEHIALTGNHSRLRCPTIIKFSQVENDEINTHNALDFHMELKTKLFSIENNKKKMKLVEAVTFTEHNIAIKTSRPIATHVVKQIFGALNKTFVIVNEDHLAFKL